VNAPAYCIIQQQPANSVVETRTDPGSSAWPTTHPPRLHLHAQVVVACAWIALCSSTHMKAGLRCLPLKGLVAEDAAIRPPYLKVQDATLKTQSGQHQLSTHMTTHKTQSSAAMQCIHSPDTASPVPWANQHAVQWLWMVQVHSFSKDYSHNRLGQLSRNPASNPSATGTIFKQSTH